MIFDNVKKTLTTPAGNWTMQEGLPFISLQNAFLRLEFGALQIGNADENSSILNALRLHGTVDQLVADALIKRTLPFGSEYQLTRRLAFGGGFCRLTTDIDPGVGAVADLSLEPVSFTGKWQKLTIFELTGTQVEVREVALQSGVLYQSANELLAFTLTDGDGKQAEFGCGNNLWRHAPLTDAGAAAGHFELRLSGDTVTYLRHYFSFAEQKAAPRRRSYRYEHYLAVSTEADTATAAATVDLATWELDAECANNAGRGCWIAAVMRRKLKELIRKNASGSLLLTNAAPELCDRAAHLERPGKNALLHWDVEDFIEFYLWSNKQLAKTGAQLTIRPPQGAWSANLLVSKLLQTPLTGLIDLGE